MIQMKSHQIHQELGLESGYSFAVACPAVFMMLCGLSLELLYKALIIEIGNRPPEIHDLRRLSAVAQITMSVDDFELLDILTAHITWAGKYPVPRGDRQKWDKHVERMYAALTDPVPGMIIGVVRRNDRLYWEDYSRIWDVAATRYWELHHKRSR